MQRILVIHGLGMNMRGKVKQLIYGHETLDQYNALIVTTAEELGLGVEIFQSNLEGEVVNKIYEGMERGVAGAVINPAGFSMQYRGIVIAIEQVGYPVFEVHVSNPMLRGNVSDVAKVCKGSITGFGINGYRLAMIGLSDLIAKKAA